MPVCHPFPSCCHIPRRCRRAWMAGLLLLAACCLQVFALPQEPTQEPGPETNPQATQDPAQPPPRPEQPADPSAPPALANVARATVHGVVKNAATGEPLPRALVRIEGDAMAGALTDGEGRFEIPGVPVGPETFQVIKPGFIDQTSAGMGGPPTVVNGSSNSEHNVNVVSEFTELAFSLAPTNAICGQIELSTGDPAQGITVLLLHRAVQDGRAVWQPVTNTRTNSQGNYRFAGLTDGAYAVFPEPTMDSDIPAAFVEAGSGPAVARAGYPSVFYPDAADLSGAAKIQVAGGQQAQANLLLSGQPFHLVRACITLPHARNQSAGPQLNVSVMVLDAQGHQLPYTGQYDPATHSVQAFLPDGTYAFQVTALDLPGPTHFDGPRAVIGNGRENRGEGHMIGRVDFSVAGHAVTHLQVPLTTLRGNTVQVSVIRSGLGQEPANNGPQAPPIVLMVSQAG